MSNPNSSNTKAPDFAKTYKQGIQTYLQFLPKELSNELAYRQQYSPQFTQQALDLQHQFDPPLAQEQLDALQRRDPQWLALHQSLGDKISQALSQGYIDPRQEAAYQKLSGLAGTVDPRQEAAYNQWSQLASKQAQLAGQVDAQRGAAYKALGKQVTGDTLRGTTADPATLHQMTQAILSRQPSLSYGEAQDMASAVYVGQRGQALQQQRQAATGNFLQQATPEQQQQASLAQGAQGLGQFYQSPSITQQKQQSLGSFYGMNAPEMQAYGLAGTFIQPSNSVTGAINQIQGVTAPSAMQYVNPNAGYQGVQFGLQNYQNSLASQNQGSSNPWTGALQGAATGAQYGSIGGGYGALGGGLIGAAAGAFGYPTYSDERLKQNVTRTGVHTKDGIEQVEFDMFGRRYKGGVIAQETQRIRPDAVGLMNGYLTVNYAKLGIETPQACDALPCRAGPGIAGPSPSQPSLSSKRYDAGQKSTEQEVQ